MLFEEIAQYKLRLRFAIRLNLIIDRHIDRLVQEFRKFFRTSCFDRFLHLINYISLSERRTKGRNRHRKNQKKAKNGLLHDGFYGGQNYATPIKIIKICGDLFCNRFPGTVIFTTVLPFTAMNEQIIAIFAPANINRNFKKSIA